MPPNDPTPDDPELIDDREEMVTRDALVRLFGDTPRPRLIAAFLEAHPRPMNPATIVDQANVSRQTWYRHCNDLLESGIIKQSGNAGNSPMYVLVSSEHDQRVEWLEKLRDWTAAYLRSGDRPE